MTIGPLTQISPDAAAPRATCALPSSSTMRISAPGTGLPTLPGLFIRGVLTAMARLVSVMPYASRSVTPHANPLDHPHHPHSAERRRRVLPAGLSHARNIPRDDPPDRLGAVVTRRVRAPTVLNGDA